MENQTQGVIMRGVRIFKDTIADFTGDKVKIIALAVVMICTLGRSMALFLNDVSAGNADGEAVSSMPEPPKASLPLPDVRTVAVAGWFGFLPEEQAVMVQSASENSLLKEFELKGISHSAEKKFAGAFIAQKGKPEAYYRMGDLLPDGVGKVAEIFPDHIIVLYGQVPMALEFPHTMRKPDL